MPQNTTTPHSAQGPFLPVYCAVRGCPNHVNEHDVRSPLRLPSANLVPEEVPQFQCSRCAYTVFCSAACQAKSWPWHKDLCNPFIPAFDRPNVDSADPSSEIIEKEFFHYITYSANLGEIAVAARSALKIQKPGSLVGEKSLNLHFNYVGPPNPTCAISRQDIPLLRTHFRFNDATVSRASSASPTFKRAMSNSKSMEERHKKLREKKEGPLDWPNDGYLLRAMLSVPGSSIETRIFYLFANIPSKDYGYFLFDWNLSSRQHMRGLPTLPDWQARLKNAFKDDLSGITSTFRTLWVIGAEVGLSKEDSILRPTEMARSTMEPLYYYKLHDSAKKEKERERAQLTGC